MTFYLESGGVPFAADKGVGEFIRVLTRNSFGVTLFNRNNRNKYIRNSNTGTAKTE